MASLKEVAQGYTPKQTKNIADLEVVPIEQLEVKEENDVEYPYKYIVKGADKYRIPNSVLEQLQAILKEKPSLKSVRVARKGEGLKTSYTVIPLD